jgi:hypothetical protein
MNRSDAQLSMANLAILQTSSGNLQTSIDWLLTVNQELKLGVQRVVQMYKTIDKASQASDGRALTYPGVEAGEKGMAIQLW